MKRRAILVMLGTMGAFGLAVALPSVRWRVEAVYLVATGRIPDLGMRELLPLLKPHSDQPEIGRILVTRSPYPVLHVPASFSEEDEAAGAERFGAQCATCHGPQGSGGAAPPLFGRDFTHGNSDWALYRTIQLGIPGSAMPPHDLPPPKLWELVAYIHSLERLPQQDASRERAYVDVPAAALAATVLPADDWLTYSGSYSSARHSVLAQIDSRNVNRLAVRWIHQIPGLTQTIECSPLVRSGVMFVTVPPDRVMALDAATGHILWTHTHPVEVAPGAEGPGGHSRGVALLDDKVFYATWDAKLETLSATTGKVLWETTVADYPRSYISGAPLVVGDLVITGIGSSKNGTRGFIAAYDVKTGRERWRFFAIPSPGEPNGDSWSGDSWKNGGGGTWLTGSYDPMSDLLYWGVGNPKPDFDTSVRKGDNLYTNSVVALRAHTGNLVWSFQFTPHDNHDWDSNQVPVIADQRLLWANRNGFYYVLDRDTGHFRTARPFVFQNWAEGLTAEGRPRLRAAASARGELMFPGANGGTNWWPPSLDPQLDLLFVPVLEQGMVFFPNPGTLPETTGRSFYTAVRALNPSTGELVWEHRFPNRVAESHISGLLSTDGRVLFAGDRSRFEALDSRTGQELWSIESGGNITGAPVTYTVGGEQFVTVAAGSTFLTFALPRT